MIIAILPVVRSLMAFIIFHQLEQISVDLTGLVLLVAAVRKAIYTLSFDSPKCVDVKRCTVGLVLVTTLSLLYWIAVVIAVFVMIYFKVSFGSLYAIVYYYSIIDILLSQVLFISNGLYTVVTIMDTLAKLTPQFLGQLCLIENMSGIDQQFIHYVHPVIVFLILVMISRIARKSHRVSSFSQ